MLLAYMVLLQIHYHNLRCYPVVGSIATKIVNPSFGTVFPKSWSITLVKVTQHPCPSKQANEDRRGLFLVRAIAIQSFGVADS